jgi:hypothetical protein
VRLSTQSLAATSAVRGIASKNQGENVSVSQRLTEHQAAKPRKRLNAKQIRRNVRLPSHCAFSANTDFQNNFLGLSNNKMLEEKELSQAKSLLKKNNQLIIIAVLIGLIYVAAGIVLALANQSLVGNQKWPLVVFMAVFPLFALGTFAWLVSKHHTKLYAGTPSIVEMSLNTLTPDQQRRKLNAEVSSILSAVALSGDVKKKTNADVASRGDVRTAFIVAEDLALRQLELEYGETFMRHAALEGVPFDGVWVNNDKIAGIEVKFLDVPLLPQESVDSLLDKAEYAAARLKRTRPDASFAFVLALVTQLNSEEQTKLRMGLENKFALTPVKKIELKMFDFDNLQNTFTADERHT